MMHEFQTPSGLSPERVNHNHNYSTTPLLPQDRFFYNDSQFRVIEHLLEARKQDIEQVYGEEGGHVKNLLVISLCNALNHRLDRASTTAYAYIAEELPSLCEGLKGYDKNLAIQVFLARGQELDELLEGWHSPVVTPEDIPEWYSDYRRVCDTLRKANSPGAALSLLIDNENLTSVELASQNRPFYWDATHDMDEAVLAAVRSRMPLLITENDDLELVERNSSLKVARYELEEAGKVRFVIIPKKRLFAKDPVTGIEVYKRSSFLLDLHHANSDENQNGLSSIRKLTNQLIKIQQQMGNLPEEEREKGEPMHNIHDAVARKISELLDELLSQPQNERPDWLQPVATSYYALRP